MIAPRGPEEVVEELVLVRSIIMLLLAAALPAFAAPLASVEVTVETSADAIAADGVVEAVRQSDIAAQVPGRVTALLVKAGDTVKAGQTLVRIDERIAQQQASAGRSQVAALAAQLDAATKEYERQQTLFKQGFLSRAALDRAESQFKTVQAQTRAQMAQVQSAVVQTGLHVLSAPYAGVVSKVDVELGDMASPGKPLITLYDPAAMRVSVNVPQMRIANLRKGAVKVEIPSAPAALASLDIDSMTILPSADPVSQMVQIRLPLPPNSRGLVPGMFARALLPVSQQGKGERIKVPSSAVFRRSELTAVYVVGRDGKPQLRLIRTGRIGARQTEVVSGLEAGERVVLDPLAAIPQH